MQTNPMKDAIAEAVSAVDLGTDPEELTPAAPAAGEGEPSKGDVQPGEAQSEGGEAATDGEVPTEYWGVPLDGIEPEKVREIIAHFEQQDSTIRKLQERLTAEPEAPETPTAPTEPEVVTDEDLLVAAGYDPEDMEVQQMARFILPSLRRELALEDQLTQLTTARQVDEVQQQWETQLAELQGAYGKLPFTDEQILKFAIDEQISSPFEVYFRLNAPAKREVEDIVGKARREAAKRAESGSLKPRTSGAGSPPVTENMTLREAVAAAAKSAEEETGHTWKGIFRKG